MPRPLCEPAAQQLVAIVPDDEPIMPKEVRQQIGFSKDVFGNFVLCPFTRDVPGVMQLACIASASNVSISEFQGSGAPQVRKLSGEFRVAEE